MVSANELFTVEESGDNFVIESAPLGATALDTPVRRRADGA